MSSRTSRRPTKARGGQLSAPSTTSEAHVLLPADARHLAWAEEHWPQLDASEINWEPVGRRKVTHRETGEVLRIALGSPAGHEQYSAVVAYCIRDGRLILLEKPGGQRMTSTIYQGAIVGRKLGPDDKRGAIR